MRAPGTVSVAGKFPEKLPRTVENTGRIVRLRAHGFARPRKTVPLLVSTPWKVLVVANRDVELKPLRQELERVGRAADLQLVRSGTEVVRELEAGGCDAVLLTAHVSHLHLAHVLAELHRREPLLPVILVARAAEAGPVLDAVNAGITGVVLSEVIALLGPTLEREIQRCVEARAQQRQHQRVHWLERAMSAAPIALAVTDGRGVLHWANAGYLALAGLKAEQVEGASAKLWGDEADRWVEVHEALRAGRIWRGSIPAAPGRTAAAIDQLLVAELAQAGGESWYVVARQGSAGVVDESPARLAAAQRHELFAAIAGGIAHDLNNILSPITMAANILGEQELSEENGELVHTIEHSAERGAAVIRQVLTFAHGSDNCEMVLQPRYLLREIARLAAEIFPPSIGVRAELPSTLWSIVGDPAEVHQALINVLINARDAMPDGGHIAITARNQTLVTLPSSPFFSPAPGEFVEISIEDTGAGLDPEVASRVWEPFVTTKGGGQAAGLGLSRVAGVLRSHGGFGEMHARAGCGTKVSLFFPRGAAKAISAVEEAPAPASQDMGRILVVDDEETILKLSRRILEHAGYEVLVASDGREALGLFMRHRAEISLVMTDLAMPGMNGFTLVWALRRAKPDLRVMVATGQGTDANLRELELMGVREVLLKPFTSRRLLDAVARTLAEPVQCEPDLFLEAHEA